MGGRHRVVLLSLLCDSQGNRPKRDWTLLSVNGTPARSEVLANCFSRNPFSTLLFSYVNFIRSSQEGGVTATDHGQSWWCRVGLEFIYEVYTHSLSSYTKV